jgi:hypothetical protein
MLLLRQVPNVVGSREGWQLYIVTGGMMLSRPSRRLLQYTAPNLICFPQHWAPISAGSCLTP